MNNVKGLSVIICCYNSAQRITATLKHLSDQTRHPGFIYEIILVDNNCTDNTVETATNYWNLVNNSFPLHIVEQPKPGLTYARKKGVVEAHFEYLIFCDDDNWLCKDYLKKTIILFETLPDVSLIGGVGEPVFESDPPAWFNSVKGFGYAIGKEGRTEGYVESVYGAGMGIRKTAFIKLMEKGFTFILTDRTCNSLASGGDLEICLIFKKACHKIYMDNDLSFKHFITTNRLQWHYYLKLRKEFGVSNAFLLAYKNEGLVAINNKILFQFQALCSYLFFLSKRTHFFLFPWAFKNASCAGFLQILSMKKTLLCEGHAIRALSKKIHHPV